MMFNNILLIIILYATLLLLSGKRYNLMSPAFYFLHPNNLNEVEEVVKSTKSRTKNDEYFFNITDESVVNAFKPFVPNISKEKLLQITLSENNKICFLKYFINRARPSNVSNHVKLMDSTKANTPAFPAGHAAQAYILANYLQKKYPQNKLLYEKIADKCNECRIKAGFHYPSDGMYSKLLFYDNV